MVSANDYGRHSEMAIAKSDAHVVVYDHKGYVIVKPNEKDVADKAELKPGYLYVSALLRKNT